MRKPRSADASVSAPPAGEFEALVIAHHDDIHRYLRRMTGRRSDAEDLAQETFLRAYRAFAALAPDANRRSWLYTIATNAYRNHVRSERRRESAHTTVRVVRRAIEAGSAESEAVANELQRVVEVAVRKLPLRQRLAFTMRKLAELDYDTIGESLDCSAETARAHVFQALKKIRASLDQQTSRRERSAS
jgi:RNA polymerase sigma-70 factor (ECF subfamily)